MYLSVIIPAYNEEKRIGKTILSINEYLKKQNYSSEILVVDNGSTDKTKEIVDKFFQTIKNLRLIEPKKIKGYNKGYAVKKGMLETKGDYRIFTDADNSTSIEQIEKFWPYFKNGYQVVFGSRGLPKSEIKIHQPWFRELPGRMSNLLIRFLILPGIYDTQCGFKCFTAKAAEDIFSKTTIMGWGFDMEVLVIAKFLGYKIKEVPISWINDPESKVSWKDYVSTLKELLEIKWNLLRKKYK